MLTLDRNDICLAPRVLKTFEFPLWNVPASASVEESDFILKPSIYRKVKKIKKTAHGVKSKSKSKSNKSTLQKKAHLTYLTNLALKPRKAKTLTFHFAGISSNNVHTSNSTRLQFDGIELETIITIKTRLKASDSIQQLKQLIRNTFNIHSSHHQLLILYSHIVISRHNDSKLNEFGITNKSLLLIAISARNHHSHKKHAKAAKRSFNEQKVDFKNKVARPSIDRLDIKCTKGFDVITQEANVNVYRMPLCGHVMSKESLYHYAVTHFEDKSKLHLSCPHTADIKEEEKYEEDRQWMCALCTFMNEENDSNCAMCNNAKPWSCVRCTFINYQGRKCELCDAEAPQLRIVGSEKKDNLCRELWDYSLIKSILITKEKKIKSDKDKVPLRNDEKQKVIDEYYALRHRYSTLKHKYEDIPLEFQRRIRKIQKQLINEFNMIDKTEVNKIRKKAKKDAALNKFRYPNANKLDRERMWKETAKLELLSARNNIQNKYKLQTCPKCETLHYKERKAKSTKRKTKSRHKMARYKTRCALCTAQSFCFCCGKSWESGHLCDSQFRFQLIEILKQAQTKKIGEVKHVPSIRCCPKCCQLITHTEACKHMECRGCKTKFCFVCMKLYKNGGWQCGSSGARCAIAPRQNMKTLPNIVAINEESFQLF